jgi:hypothetical protein
MPDDHPWSSRLSKVIPSLTIDKSRPVWVGCKRAEFINNPMKDFKLETSFILKRFLERQIDFPQYVVERDASLARAMPRFTDSDTPQLRVLLMEMNESVMEEMLRRLAADQLAFDDEPEVSTQLARGSHSLRSVLSIVGR